MAFSFEPMQTRAAIDRIEKLFPTVGARPPAGLEALFKIMGQLALDDVPRWSTRLNGKEIDLLCHYFERAPSPRIHLAIFLVLAVRKDHRCGAVLRTFFYALPDSNLLSWLKQYWPSLTVEAVMGQKLRWICRYFSDAVRVPLQTYTIDKATSGEPLDNILNAETVHTPLIKDVMGHIFREGGELLRRIPPEVAANLAASYLEEGQDILVQSFLKHYPVAGWKPRFLERLYRKKGPPDPGSRAFYLAFDTGRLWAIRTHLYSSRMASMVTEGARHAFWSGYLHLCQDWRYKNGQVLARIRPYRIVEKGGYSYIYLLDGPEEPIATLAHDHNWEDQMEALLSECRLL